MTTKVPAVMTSEAVTASQVSAKADDSAAVKLTGDQTVAGAKTFSTRPIVPAQSMVRLNTANGYGSTNDKIRRFTNVVTNAGSDITYADSAANGASFTINTAGVYAISYSDQFSSATNSGLSLNSAALTTGITALAVGEQLAASCSPSANNAVCVSWTGYLAANSVVRPHTSGTASGTSVNACQFTITRVD